MSCAPGDATPDGWVGYVRYAVSPGMRYLDWGDAERVCEANWTVAGRPS